MYSGASTQRPNFGKEIWREARSHWKNRLLGAGGLRDLSPSGVEGCEGPNGAFRRGALRRRPRQQARRCGADPGLPRQTPDFSGAATGAEAALRGVGAHRARAPVIKVQNREKEKLCATEAPPECKDRPGGKRVDHGVDSKMLCASQGGAQEAGGSNSAGCT
ncbi:unnamed protein product [Rangifer tarandus platyrhynchus]|uniref:Uncharacterized protein n=1 Tax=Rangifer tarandus platyrhynchus TaxID=3082113 RepID=A0ABN8YKE8_RANTA|nr:unnamed protein product [Rangifer tarandus platyrhynchus]